MTLEHVEAKEEVDPSPLWLSDRELTEPEKRASQSQLLHTHLHDGEGTWQE
jgi:hypothetical protein